MEDSEIIKLFFARNEDAIRQTAQSCRCRSNNNHKTAAPTIGRSRF